MDSNDLAELEKSLAPQASSKRNPLLKYSVTCPICGEVSLQYRLNPKLFWNDSQDLDLQPRKFQSIKGYENHHPPLYYMWHCEKCNFTASYKNFSEPLKATHMRVDIVRQKLREAAQNNPAFCATVEILGGPVDSTNPSFFDAIRLNLLAICLFDQILPLLKQNFITQARYYLRLAWLHRDLSERPNERAKTAPLLDALLGRLRAHWPDIPADEPEALRKAMEFYGKTLGDASSMKTPVDRVNILQLMARIHYKLGEYRLVQELLMDSADKAAKARGALDHDLKMHRPASQGLTPEQSGEMISQRRKLESLINDAQMLMDQVRDHIIEEQNAKAQELISALPSKTPEAIRAVLSQNGIDPAVIARLTPEPKKKGLFGFFK